VTPTASASVKAGTVDVIIGMDKGDTIAAGSSAPTSLATSASSSGSGPTSGNGENGGTISGNGPDSVDGIPCLN
jgi:hypothetical protein